MYLGFQHAESSITTPSIRALLHQARSSWEDADAAVLAAPELAAAGAVQEALAAGEDPFRDTMWAPYGAAGSGISEIQRLSAADLRDRVAAMDRLQQVVNLSVAAAVALAVALAVLASRRMTRQVVKPLVELRRRAVALQNLEVEQTIDVDDAIVELRDLAGTITDTATSLRASHSRLRDQAYRDALTGLSNRKAFSEWLAARAAADKARVGVLFIDLDDFKIVNDSLGHDAGDDLLRIVAGRLLSATRDCDMVARLGGDEFAVAVGLTDRTDPSTTVARRILEAFAEPVSIAGTTVTVGCSIGIAVTQVGTGPDGVGDALRNADIAMYMAKSHGKNRFEVFAASMHSDMVAGMELKQDLANAVHRDQFELHYQPVIDLDTGDVLGFEALIRWNHPTRGLLAPREFIALAEDTGDIVDIGSWVIEQACRDLAGRLGEAPVPWVSVNVSASQINGAPFVTHVRDTLARHGIPPGLLMLEITEAVAMADQRTARSTLSAVRDLGVQVALDDFGTGFSSLQYLRDLPVDVLKVDRSFVSDQRAHSDSMLEAIVRLGRSFGLDVIAEGIETPDELQRLRRLGSLAGQGYLFARPMPLHDVIPFTAERMTTLHSTRPTDNEAVS